MLSIEQHVAVGTQNLGPGLNLADLAASARGNDGRLGLATERDQMPLHG
jgi:hypothetical protein